jgi:hypothetical protein
VASQWSAEWPDQHEAVILARYSEPLEAVGGPGPWTLSLEDQTQLDCTSVELFTSTTVALSFDEWVLAPPPATLSGVFPSPGWSTVTGNPIASAVNIPVSYEG